MLKAVLTAYAHTQIFCLQVNQSFVFINLIRSAGHMLKAVLHAQGQRLI